MKLIIINGLPGTGKTTIARPLSQSLGLPLIEKDTIKEFLFNSVGVGDREWSKILGKASTKFLYDLTGELLAKNRSVIIESAFEVSFARPAVERLIEVYKPEVFEIYCITEKTIRRQRFVDRNESSERHHGHVDSGNYPDDSEAEPLDKYAPIGLGKIITIDTSNNKVDVEELVSKLA